MDRIFRSTGLLQLVTFCLCGSGRSLKLLDGTLPVEYAHCQYNESVAMGLYRENAIAIESEARDRTFGGNVYYVTMQITLPPNVLAKSMPVLYLPLYFLDSFQGRAWVRGIKTLAIFFSHVL